MGRELKRVPLDFNAPLNQTWSGYINPHKYCRCPACEGDGYSPSAKRAQDRWYGYIPFSPEENGSKPFGSDDPVIVALAKRNYPKGDKNTIVLEGVRLANHFNSAWCFHLNDEEVAALIAANRLMDFTHTWTKDAGWQKNEPLRIPTAQEVNNWSVKGFGHDSSNCYIVVKHYCEKNGLSVNCVMCNGSGEYWESDKAKEEYEAWQSVEPPEGEGYQLWENTSEGSPISPVFKTLEELCAWAETGATIFGDSKLSKEEWLETLGKEFVTYERGNFVFI